MSETLHQTVLMVLDKLFGPALALPRDVAIVGLATLTVAMMLVARVLCTNQDLLRRCRADLAQLKRLRKETKRQHDRPARQRIARTIAQVQWMQMKADLRVLAIVIAPLAAIATWAVERLEYWPIQRGESVTLTARFPLSSVDRVAHLVPLDPELDDALDSPALQAVTLDPQDDKHGVARWRIRCGSIGPPRRLALIVRHQGESATHVVEVGTGKYQPPQQTHDRERIVETSVRYREYRFLNVVPGLPWLGLPPWMVAYVLLTIVLTSTVRRGLRIG